jgi:Xaa-Pro dipeptidase
MPDFDDRLNRLRILLAEKDLDAIILVKPENLYYFTGFWGAAPIRMLSLIIPRDSEPILILPRLEEDYATLNSWIKNIRSYVEFVPDGEPDDPVEYIATALSEKKLDHARIGYEADVLPASIYQRLQQALPDVNWKNGSNVVYRLRMIKSPEEIEKVRGASSLVDRKVSAAVKKALPGYTELDLGVVVAYEAAIESKFLISPYNLGVPVVATGLRSALPHGRASMEKIKAGDLLVIDLCAIAFFEAYHAGFTRTFSIGKPTAKQEDIYKIVLEANVEAINAVRPGITASQIDMTARNVINDAGFGEYFTHRTGRSVGLDVGEPPYLRQDDHTVLEPGMTIVIEPGIYIAGFGGVRIEDTVLVTENGSERLTQYPIEFIDLMEKEKLR